MTQRRHSLLAVALTLFAAATLRADDIDDYIKRLMQSDHIPGLAVVVVKDGVIIKSQAYGLADIENEIPAHPDTVFKIGSVSKQFIAAGIMLLAQDGKLAVDDKVVKYMEGSPGSWQPITIRHLLTHTGGLVREGPAFDPYKVQPDIDVIKSAFSAPLQFKPGEKYEYSNLGYFVLGEIIRRVIGKPWAEFLNDRIFAPLEMTATRATTVPEIVSKRAAGYAWNTDRFQNAPNWPAVRPSGAFLSTVLDLAKWETALMTDRILSDASKKEMWTPVVLNSGEKYPYGFGWQLNDWPANPPSPTGIPMIRHGGSMPGFRAGYFRWPSYKLAVIVLMNRENTNIDGIGANIAIRAVPELRRP